MNTLAQQLATYTADLTLEQVPATTRARAKLLILDAIGAALAAASFDFGKRAVEGLATLDSGDAQVFGLAQKLSVRDAVLVNGILTHGLDFDDTSISARVHAGACCTPTALTLAAALNCNGAQTLTAWIAGMECAMRIGAAAKGGFKDAGFYPIGVAGVFAASLIAGRLMNLNAAQLANAQGVAYSTASGNGEYAEEMAWTKRMHPGWAGVGGVTAALLAKGGYVGPTLPYEGQNGLYRAYLGEHKGRADITLATKGLNTEWEIDKVAFKPMPACYFSIASIDSACALHHAHGLNASNIANVRILLPKGALESVALPAGIRRKPVDTYAAVFSAYYGVAVGLARGRYGLSDLEPAALADTEVLSLIERSDYEIDPHTTFPKFYSGAVRVTTTDGRVLEHREDIHRGSPEKPLSEADIVAKFMDNAARSVSRLKAEQVRDAVLNLETVSNIKTITGWLAP